MPEPPKSPDFSGRLAAAVVMPSAGGATIVTPDGRGDIVLRLSAIGATDAPGLGGHVATFPYIDASPATRSFATVSFASWSAERASREAIRAYANGHANWSFQSSPVEAIRGGDRRSRRLAGAAAPATEVGHAFDTASGGEGSGAENVGIPPHPSLTIHATGSLDGPLQARQLPAQLLATRESA
jgi:hypothetical protein